MDETLSLASDDSADEVHPTDREDVRCACKGKCMRARSSGRGCKCKAAGVKCIRLCMWVSGTCKNRDVRQLGTQVIYLYR
jgi:hypothetical protein